MVLRRLFQSLVLSGAKWLSFDDAVFVADRVLQAQGFGYGGGVGSSGEAAVFDLLKRPAPVLFDVGAHLGDYTAEFLRVHPDGRAFVFEPSQPHFAALARRLEGCANVRLIRGGLGARSGEVPLYKDAEISGLASLTKRRLDHFNRTMDRVELVKVQTLDEALSEFGVASIDLLKIDVEGHELDVLRGAAQAFRDHRIELVQFEFGGSNLDTRTSLQDFFYFFKPYEFTIGLIQPSGRIQWLPEYGEILEQYRTTNFLATCQKIGIIL